MINMMGLIVCHVGVCTASLKEMSEQQNFRSCNLMMNILCAVQRQMSVAQIEYAETMENGKPKAGGLSDPRMGTVDRKIKCQTCMTGMAECPGHFGHLELAKPMFHIGFMKTVLSIMRCLLQLLQDPRG